MDRGSRLARQRRNFANANLQHPEAELSLPRRDRDRRHTDKTITLDEIKSAAFMGLVLAWRKFDPERGVKFSTHAYHNCTWEIIRWFDEQHHLKPSQRQGEKRLKVPAPVSVSAPVAGTDNLTLGDLIPAKEERLALDDRDQVDVLLERVDNRTREMIQIYYFCGLTTTKVAGALGLSTQMVDKLFARARRVMERERWQIAKHRVPGKRRRARAG